MLKKILIMMTCLLGTSFCFMQAARMLNQPNWIWNAIGLTIVIVLTYHAVKTNLFTKFKK